MLHRSEALKITGGKRMDTLVELFQAALRHWLGRDVSVEQIASAGKVAHNHSGSIVHFYDVTYRTAQGSAQIPLITKDTLVYERQILALLNAQAHPIVPLSYSLDLQSREPQLLCQQDAGLRMPLSPAHLATVASGLATIHAANAGAPYLPWMRRLTRATFFAWWQPAWDQACAQADFVREFEAYLHAVEQAAQRFAHTLDGFWQEASALTVLHTDLSAWHVLLRDDQPTIIDWDQARFGPRELDLVNLFTLETVPRYYHAARQSGLPLSYAAFLERFHAAWRSLG
jgi:hypothetical protein